MAIRYYDDLLAEKLKRWVPENSKLRVLKPDETKRLFETKADDNNDKNIKLPFIALSRNPDIQLLSNIKQAKSYAGLKLSNLEYFKTGNPEDMDTVEGTLQLNVIPIQVNYQLDIYTKTFEEGDEYLRNFLFKLINNPVMVITIPYHGQNFQHVVNIRVDSTVSDTSGISERLYSGQFTRWTITMELQDAFLFNIPYRRNWLLDGFSFDDGSGSGFEVFENTTDLDVDDELVINGEVDAEIEPIFKEENE